MLLSFGRRPPAGPGYRLCNCLSSASTDELTVRQGPARRPRRFQLPMLGDPVQPPMLRDRSRRLLSPVIGASPLPTPPPAWSTDGGSAPQPPLRCLLFLSWVLTAQGNPLGPRPKPTTCRNLRLPRFRSGNLRGARSSAFRHPLATAHALGSRANGRTSTEHAWEPRPANLLQRGGAFPRGPRRLPPRHWRWDPGARF
ncbi:hypothetical protein mRhiFer1_007831 [Rhinolophus ferrumequinum]|uniref:Uncharacterized protein n=1 Tax=Rhinolophus ferrumequinum TaxID=59479 RepID=A0A7J8AVF4_RHIFE|nr:hypothetical protein mRhiFer1_007831 [Rhinolophus ferrumequinum]